MLVKPPYRPLWFFRARSLVEFPPAVAYGRLYFANATGTLFAVDTSKVKARWTFRAARCTAASPAVDGHTVYMSFLNKPPCNATRSGLDGQVVALNADTGKVRWRVTIGPTESSPLVVDGVVYVGDWTGKVYALTASTGTTRWTFQTGDKVKGAISYAGGRVFFGSYDHHVYAVNARTGKLFWSASAQQRLGPRGRVLLDPRCRLRPRLHRLDRRQGLLVRRHERQAALVARHRRLRLRLAGGLAGARLRRLLQRQALLLRRGHGRRALDVHGARLDLRIADRDQRRPLLLDAEEPHLRARPAHRASCSGPSAAAPMRRSSPTGAGSTSSATRESSAWLPACRVRLAPCSGRP